MRRAVLLVALGVAALALVVGAALAQNSGRGAETTRGPIEFVLSTAKTALGNQSSLREN